MKQARITQSGINHKKDKAIRDVEAAGSSPVTSIEDFQAFQSILSPLNFFVSTKILRISIFTLDFIIVSFC